MALDLVRTCEWCDKEFTPIGSQDTYSLSQAGISVCLDCADKWEDTEIKLGDKIKGFWDAQARCLRTANGHILPILWVDWTNRKSMRTFRNHLVGHAVDIFGQDWICKHDRDTLYTLIPQRGVRSLWA